MKRWLGHAVGITLLVASGLGVWNVYADSRPVEDLAKKTACEGQGPKCGAALARMMKTPVFIDFSLRQGRREVEVRCARAYLLLGDYACTAKK